MCTLNECVQGTALTGAVCRFECVQGTTLTGAACRFECVQGATVCTNYCTHFEILGQFYLQG